MDNIYVYHVNNVKTLQLIDKLLRICNNYNSIKTKYYIGIELNEIYLLDKLYNYLELNLGGVEYL